MRGPRHKGLCNFSQFTALASGGNESKIQLQGVVCNTHRSTEQSTRVGRREKGARDLVTVGGPRSRRAGRFFTVCCSAWFHLIAFSFHLQAWRESGSVPESAFDILYFMPMKLCGFLIVGCFFRINEEIIFKGIPACHMESL